MRGILGVEYAGVAAIPARRPFFSASSPGFLRQGADKCRRLRVAVRVDIVQQS